jgi:predicted secreted hydrolase
MTRIVQALAWASLCLLVGIGSGSTRAADAVWLEPASDGGPQVAAAATPAPVRFPRDHGPHDLLTEWWYYTGHLASQDGRRFGFEYVIFRAERDPFGVGWAAHLAVTDEQGGRFAYDQRAELGDRADRSVPDEGFDLAIAGDVDPGIHGREPTWNMTGGLGDDRLAAQGERSRDGLAIGLELELHDEREPLLHGDDGYVTFDASTGSYYYSRPRMVASGVITLGDEELPVSGSAWFDHQWGDFLSVGTGWDWFAVNLDDGTDLTVSVVRAPQGRDRLVYGTIRDEHGSRSLVARDITVEVQGQWTSPWTAITWPAGWRLEIPGEGLVVELRPTVADQELDTRATTGVVYWEGSQVVHAERDGVVIGGAAYVELTGYEPEP